MVPTEYKISEVHNKGRVKNVASDEENKPMSLIISNHASMKQIVYDNNLVWIADNVSTYGTQIYMLRTTVNTQVHDMTSRRKQMTFNI